MSEYDIALLDWEDDIFPDGTDDRHFVVDDDYKADWAVRKIQAAAEERDRLNDTRMKQIRALQRAVDEEDARCEQKTNYLRSLLQVYFEGVPHAKTKTQETYKLPSGKLVWKKASSKITHDDAKLLEWLGHQPEDIRSKFTETVTKVKWGELKKLLAVSGDKVWLDGEAVPGVALEPVDGTFEVK